MDKTMRVLLSIGIAILYPVVVYFVVLTFMPKPSESKYPTYPNCSRNYSSSRYVRDDCDRQYDDYDKKLEEYRDSLDREEHKNVTRAQIALGIALLTIIGAVFFLRDVKEVAAGLAVGSMVVIVSAVSIIATNAGDDPTSGNALLLLVSFVLLTAALYLIEKGLPNRRQNVADTVNTANQPEPPVTPPGE